MTITHPSKTSELDAVDGDGSTLGDAWTITRRQFWHWRAQPGVLAVGLLFPVLVTLMFGALFGGAIASPGTEYAGNYYAFLMPGIFVMAMLFGLESTMTAVNMDAAKGVTDRFRSLPISPAAVVLGRFMADMINSIVGLAVLVIAGLLLGWSWETDVPAALAAFGLLLLLRFALLWVGIFIGLVASGPEAVGAVQILVWPISMLSNLFVDPATMPGWLGAIAAWNPLSATASATRELFGNPGWNDGSALAENSAWLAIGWPVLLTAVFAPLAIRAYRRLGG
ncbi:MAG: ABC transporter permease [Nakamurella sp.]